VIGMGDEYTPEKSQRQDAVEALGSGIRLGPRETEEGYSTQLESADLHVQRRQSRKYQLPSVHSDSL
jgi:hypothetical protein